MMISNPGPKTLCRNDYFLRKKGKGRRGEGRVGRTVFRNYYKRHIDKTKGESGSRVGRWVWLG